MTQQLRGENRHNLSLTYLKARLAVMLGGSTVEEMVFGELTTGAENDLVEATSLAQQGIAVDIRSQRRIRATDRHSRQHPISPRFPLGK
jgi:cell division protease FtsH